MTQTLTPHLTLEEFLEHPETKPALEYINGTLVEKNMPQGEHSLLQGELCEVINRVARSPKIARAFPELRCTFGGRSIVPDIVVFRWERIPRTDSGKIANRFEIPPDWVIEILSPNQSHSQTLDKLLYCSQSSTSLGWLINPAEESIWAIGENQRIEVFTTDAQLPVLEGIDLELTVSEILSWLIM
ncbi:MAG: Uma2 family endonuclease [Roseofilum sp. Belize BBD 4]|uniref:Uma2 family endonuclease n=1 Tax=Roseofilum sp. Belize BBD 4 TaxID=2821500 RepID=UPI001B0C07B7|nr:Uma2 family endonuclease [Roseofilum sp. Belize BBD 4]MBP0033053.1 Uma2 family endonuclease [Roseofilum sp. Belize BBD 4]